MQQDPTLHNENLLNGTARTKLRIIIVGMALNTVSDGLSDSNYGFLIRVLHLLEGFKYRF